MGYDIEIELKHYMTLAELDINKLKCEQFKHKQFFVMKKLNLTAIYRGACVVVRQKEFLVYSTPSFLVLMKDLPLKICVKLVSNKSILEIK